MQQTRQHQWEVTTQFEEDLYFGTSGIALFFLELYKETGASQYLDVASRAAKYTHDYYQ